VGAGKRLRQDSRVLSSSRDAVILGRRIRALRRGHADLDRLPARPHAAVLIAAIHAVINCTRYCSPRSQSGARRRPRAVARNVSVEESVPSDAELVSEPGYERRRKRRGKSFRPRMMKV
jgi:hypothetical protein